MNSNLILNFKCVEHRLSMLATCQSVRLGISDLFACLKFKIESLCSIVAILFSFSAMADHSAINHAPIGVMGDHVHKKGEFMMSVRLMRMAMDSMGSGTEELSDSEYSQNIKPQDMTMDMLMIGAMYGLNDTFTFMPMINVVSKDMNLRNNMMSVDFDTGTTGIGDTKFFVLQKMKEQAGHSLALFKYGVSLPTGDIEVEDTIPVMGEVLLPYPMQLGSGTFDLSVGGTYQWYFSNNKNIGIDALYTHRLGENDQDYTFGDEFYVNLWGAYSYSKEWSFSTRLNWHWRDNINGDSKDLTITSAMNPTADPEAQGGNWANLFIGTNFSFDTGDRIAFEIGFPINQNVQGVQMLQELNMVLGWQKLF